MLKENKKYIRTKREKHDNENEKYNLKRLIRKYWRNKEG